MKFQNIWIRLHDLDVALRVCFTSGGGGPLIGEVTCGGSPHLSCKRDQIKIEIITSPTWGPAPLCKQALIVPLDRVRLHYWVCANISLKSITSITDENGERARGKMNNRTKINLNSSPVSNFIFQSTSLFPFFLFPLPVFALLSPFPVLSLIPVSLLRPELRLQTNCPLAARSRFPSFWETEVPFSSLPYKKVCFCCTLFFISGFFIFLLFQLHDS